MILVDTSAWIFLFDKRRGGAESLLAKQFYQSNQAPFAITDLILEETHKWLIHHSFPKEKALQILKQFVDENFATIIPLESSDRTLASQFLHKYLDQELSFTDAITVAVMKRLRIKKIFSFDAHFDLFPGIQRVPEK